MNQGEEELFEITPEDLTDDHEQSELQIALIKMSDQLDSLEMKLRDMPNFKKQTERILAEMNSIHQQLNWKLEQVLTQNMPSSQSSKPWKYGLGTLLVIGMINFGSTCYLAKRPVSFSQDMMTTYAFGQKIKAVWAKLSKTEKEKLAKYLD
jgi:hypothetical protein